MEALKVGISCTHVHDFLSVGLLSSRLEFAQGIRVKGRGFQPYLVLKAVFVEAELPSGQIRCDGSVRVGSDGIRRLLKK